MPCSWNSLPNKVVEVPTPSIQSFERRLDKHWRDLIFNYEAALRLGHKANYELTALNFSSESDQSPGVKTVPSIHWVWTYVIRSVRARTRSGMSVNVWKGNMVMCSCGNRASSTCLVALPDSTKACTLNNSLTGL